jgi:Skp family chaperone for outer membrane proteins
MSVSQRRTFSSPLIEVCAQLAITISSLCDSDQKRSKTREGENPKDKRMRKETKKRNREETEKKRNREEKKQRRKTKEKKGNREERKQRRKETEKKRVY